MAIVQYGKWIIDVDCEKTIEYYNQFRVSHENQIYRNYKKYCDTMPTEAAAFFESFGINPICCNPESFGMTKERTLPTSARYLVAGRYIACPEEVLISVEELVENDFEDDREDTQIAIGRFLFDFQNPDAIIQDIPEDIPEGFLCINVWFEDLPWLLEEKCETKEWYPPAWWQVIRRIREHHQFRRQQQEERSELKGRLETEFARVGMTFEHLEKKRTKELMKCWAMNYLPSTTKREMREASILGNRHYSNYLWHAFSFELLPTESSETASSRFAQTEKDGCYVLLNFERIAYRIRSASHLSSEFINQFDDILVFDDAFRWTYCHTHEEFCGPYFYDKGNIPIESTAQ